MNGGKDDDDFDFTQKEKGKQEEKMWRRKEIDSRKPEEKRKKN